MLNDRKKSVLDCMTGGVTYSDIMYGWRSITENE